MPLSVKVSIAKVRAGWFDRAKTVDQIARENGISTGALRRIVKSQGWPLRTPRAKCKLTREALKPLWDAGISSTEIANCLGVSRKAVLSMATRAGWRRGRDFKPRQSIASFERLAA